MSEYSFGTHNGHLSRKASTIARKHGAWHTNYTEPNGQRRGWFGCVNRGSPFDEAIAKAVIADVDRAGGFAALLHKRDSDSDDGE
jgi:hypothetical protein